MKLKIISWNVNGIRACVGHGFETWLKTAKPDVLGLQEIKLDDAKRAQVQFDFKDYEEFWFPAKRKGYSGTAILIRNGIKFKSVKNGINKEEFDDEGRIQTAEFEKFFLVNAYFPNAQPELKRINYKEDFNEAILRHIKKLETKKPVVLCGDLNVAHKEIDLARPKENEGTAGFSRQERAWADKFVKSGLVDTFRYFYPKKVQYSWWSYRGGARSRNVGWRIDYFWASAKLMKHVKKSVILDNIKGSDHCPVEIEMSF